MATVKIGSTTGFRYLWLKNVISFDLTNHCAKCLIGNYSTAFGLKMPTNVEIELPYKEGEIIYFCGVSAPYVWENNLHLAGIVKAESKASIKLHNGELLDVNGIEQIVIDASHAEVLYPKLGAAFLTCRNFQFAAQMLKASRAK